MNGSLFDLSGQVALVTGGNSGIGLGLATGLARAGSAVCIWGTNAGKNAAAKAAILALTRTLAVELGKYNIRANALLPGWTVPAVRSLAGEARRRRPDHAADTAAPVGRA